LSFVNADDLKSALHGLAKISYCVKGLCRPEGAKVSSKLGRWPEQYKSMADKLSSWKEASLGKPASASVNAYLKNVTKCLISAIGPWSF